MTTARPAAESRRRAGATCERTPRTTCERAARTAAVALLLLPALAFDAMAAPSWARPQAQLEPQSLVKPTGISLEQAANMVRRETGGRVLSASPTDRGGYDVRVLIDGKRVKNVHVDSDGRIRSRD